MSKYSDFVDRPTTEIEETLWEAMEVERKKELNAWIESAFRDPLPPVETKPVLADARPMTIRIEHSTFSLVRSVDDSIFGCKLLSERILIPNSIEL